MIPLNDPSGARTSALCLEYSLYLAALPPACWMAGLTSCMFAVESVGFNGALLLLAWRFSSNSSRGQAHARRLFLGSLAYLPLFFACLLLHQRRAPATLDDEAALHAEEGAAASPLEAGLEQIRARGRELCMHEQIVQAESLAAEVAAEGGQGGAAAAKAGAAADGGGGAAAALGAAGRCPIVIGSSVGSSLGAAAVGTVAQQQAVSPQQPQS